MTINYKNIGLFFLVACLILGTGFVQSWNTALFILNMGLVSAIMALGVNLQWGFAGLFNVGIMGFVALGGLAAVLISMPPTTEAWAAGGLRVILGLSLGRGHGDRCNPSATAHGRRPGKNPYHHSHFNRWLLYLSRGL